jgi:hypothetical protein
MRKYVFLHEMLFVAVKTKAHFKTETGQQPGIG